MEFSRNLKRRASANSDAWQAERQRIEDEANRKRSETQAGVPKVKANERAGTSCSRTFSRQPERKSKAKASKTNAGAVARGDKLAKDRPDLAEKVRMGTLKASKAHKLAEKDRREKDLAAAQAKVTNEKRKSIDSVCDIRVCSCAELFASGIKPDAVITDPPYPEEFLPTFTELAIGCDKVGVPLVAVMSGQSYLPEVMQRLCEHLTYRWTLAYITPGGQAVQQWDAKVNAFWKPVLLFGKATEWLGDVAASKVNDNEKRFHHWGQSESGMADLIDRLTKPGQLVCDPFVGGGSTAVACLALGRRFVGCDIDKKHVETAKARVLL